MSNEPSETDANELFGSSNLFEVLEAVLTFAVHGHLHLQTGLDETIEFSRERAIEFLGDDLLFEHYNQGARVARDCYKSVLERLRRLRLALSQNPVPSFDDLRLEKLVGDGDGSEETTKEMEAPENRCVLLRACQLDLVNFLSVYTGDGGLLAQLALVISTENDHKARIRNLTPKELETLERIKPIFEKAEGKRNISFSEACRLADCDRKTARKFQKLGLLPWMATQGA